MSLPMMLAAGAALLALVTLLVLQRRRNAAAQGDADNNDGPAETPSESARSDNGLTMDQWRPLGAGGRLRAVMRGGRHGIQLLRDPFVTVYRAVEGDAIRVVQGHDSVYGGRPNWAHIAELTRAMGKAERCWPGAELAGILSYTDSAVPVEYSPRLVADLEDETAPDPDGATVA